MTADALDLKALDIAGLREKALAAMPGPWALEYTRTTDIDGRIILHPSDLRWVSGGYDRDYPDTIAEDITDPDNAAFIAAFNPATALALLTRIESDAATIAEREAEIARLKAAHALTEKDACDGWEAAGIRTQERSEWMLRAEGHRTRAEAAEAEVARLKEALKERLLPGEFAALDLAASTPDERSWKMGFHAGSVLTEALAPSTPSTENAKSAIFELALTYLNKAQDVQRKFSQKELSADFRQADEHSMAEDFADAALRLAASASYPEPETPKTIAELQAEIGRLQAQLHYRVCGDQTVGVSAFAASRHSDGERR